MLASWSLANLHELDGALIGSGHRLAGMGMVALLNFAYGRLLEFADDEGRKRIELALEGRLGENGGEIVDDPDLPAEMQGLEAPSWWNSDHDPFADQHQLSGTDAQFHAG